jgi:hypothetical protein
MLRRLTALLLLSALIAQAAQTVFYNANDYNGGSSSVTVTGISGSNLACFMTVWTRTSSGAVFSAPLCGGNAMSLVNTFTVLATNGATFDAYISLYQYAGAGLSGSSITCAISSTGETSVGCFVVNGSAQSGQPDAFGTVTNATLNGSNEMAATLTVVTNNSLVLGVFNPNIGLSTTPSSNGTYLGLQNTEGIRNWQSTAQVASGSFSLMGKAPSGGSYKGANFAFSVKPYVAAALMVPRKKTGIIQ